MIQNVSPIEKEFLLKTVANTEQTVRFHGSSGTATGLIKNITKNDVSIQIMEKFDKNDFSVFESIMGYFDCNGKTYAFETTIREAQATQLVIDPPQRLIKSLQRKFIRVRSPKNISVVFTLSNEEISLDYPVCSEYVSVEKSVLPHDATDSLSIAGLIDSFRNRIATCTSGNTIVMFRTKKPELFEETLICNTGKVLFIPSTEGKLPKTDPYPEGRIITETLEEQFEEPDHFLHGTHFEKLLVGKKNSGITSEIWCPILFFQYVVGYIYVFDKGKSPFGLTMVDYIWDFSRVLAWNLKKTGYFNSEMKRKEPTAHTPKIIDISPGGMLFAIPENEISTPVKEGSCIGVSLTMGNKKIECTAKIVRRFIKGKLTTYGTSFINMSPEDMIILYEALYRHSFTMNNPLAYENKVKIPMKTTGI